jgi:hypothetical protein
MKRLVAAAFAVLVLMAGPAMAKSFHAPGLTGPIPTNAKILVMQPDVELSMLTMAGLSEPKAEWSQNGTNNLRVALEAMMKTKAHEIRSLNPADAMEGRSGQLLRLHDAVGASILNFTYGVYRLPTKKNNFAWTLGEGAQELAAKYDADYALFTTARGSFSSGGRIAAQIALAALGVGVAGGGTQAFVSLVDLKTGQIVWFNFAPVGDLRTSAGAEDVAAALLKDAPL